MPNKREEKNSKIKLSGCTALVEISSKKGRVRVSLSVWSRNKNGLGPNLGGLLRF